MNFTPNHSLYFCVYICVTHATRMKFLSLRKCETGLQRALQFYVGRSIELYSVYENAQVNFCFASTFKLDIVNK